MSMFKKASSSVKFVEFGGEKRPVKYGWNALAMFGDMTKSAMTDLTDFQNRMSFSDILALLYVGLYHGARAEKKEFKLTIEDIGDIMDSEDMDKVIEDFVEIFESQLPQSKKEIAPEAGL